MSQLPFYLSAPAACSYRAGRSARNLFVDPRTKLSGAQREQLASLGFRRSGPTYYRPACDACQACESTRIDIANFRPNRQQRRCWKTNGDLIASWSLPLHTHERFDLYRRYLLHRHADGEMNPDDEEGFERFLCSNPHGQTRHLLVRDPAGSLLAVAVTDQLSSGLSAVYTFFDPQLTRRSLGRYAVLRQIEACRAARLPWLYLGYYVAQSPKMRYKLEYMPQQRFIQERWSSASD